MQLYSLRILVWLLALALPGVAEASGADDTVDFDALIASLCQKRVVLLGEDAGHGAGATVAVKGRIVEALVDRCGFDTLYFESPLYEFLDFEERQARGDAQPFHLADAIGPMWAGTREFEPTLHWLWQRSRTGALRLRGMDVQMGGISQHFSERELPARLAVHAGAERSACEASLRRLTGWNFTESHPYDDAFRHGLRRCLSGIEQNLATSGDGPDRLSQRMAVSLGQFLDMSGDDDFNIRDAAMAQNIMWHEDRAPGARALVWTASSHAVKGSLPGYPHRVSLGMHLSARFGDRLASIGFSARTGTHGRPSRPPVEIAPVAASLEQRRDVGTYVDSTALHRIGPVRSTAVAYGRPLLADWSLLLDGIWLLPAETPLHARDATEPASSGTPP